MERKRREIRIVTGALAALVVVLMIMSEACVKSETSEDFAPLAPANCGDQKLNNSEYFTDCGGPNCAPCPTEGPKYFIRVDSTWQPDSIKNIQTWEPRYVFYDTLNKNSTLIRFVDTFEVSEPYHRSFYIIVDPTLPVGIHPIDSIWGFERYILAPPTFNGGTVAIQSGTIEVTNRDITNNLISGTFSFNCEPDPFYGYIFISGDFRDMPASPIETEEE